MEGQSNFWQEKNGGFGGFIYCMISDTNGDVYFGTGGAGMFRSTDDGGTWFQRNKGLPFTSIVRAIHFNRRHEMFAGVEQRGIFKSSDAGTTWKPAFSARIEVVAILSLGDSIILAGVTYNSADIFANPDNTSLYGIFRSTDNGASWSNTSNGLANNKVQALVSTDTGFILAGTEGGIFRSLDGGITWGDVSGSLASTRVWALTKLMNGQILAGCDRGIWRSTDAGGSWQSANVGVTNMYGYTPMVNTFAVSSSGIVLAAGNDYGAFVSFDSGNSWTRINSGLTDLIIQAVTINKRDFAFAGAYNRSGVFRSVQPISPQ